MTIRAKLYAAIALTILGPLLTTVVAIEGQARLGDSFNEVQQRADDAALAQEIKFNVTDMNGWQTAYGYAGDGRFREQYEASRDLLDENLTRAEGELTESTERALTSQLREGVRSLPRPRRGRLRRAAGRRYREGEADLPRPRAVALRGDGRDGPAPRRLRGRPRGRGRCRLQRGP